MAKEISHITIYKENKNTMIKLVQRICHKHQCTVQDALDALSILFKNSIAADYETAPEEISESLDNVFDVSNEKAHLYEIGDKIEYKFSDREINDGNEIIYSGEIVDHFGDGVFIALDKPLEYIDNGSKVSTNSFELYDNEINPYGSFKNLHKIEELSENLLSPEDFMKLYESKNDISYKLNSDDEHNIDHLFHKYSNDKSLKSKDLKDKISDELGINWFEVSSYLQKSNMISESKNDMSDIICGHSIQLDKKGICKITSLDGDTMIVKCQDGSTDKVSYKKYFGQDLVTEALAIDDVTQYGDNLLVTLNGHLYAYQPIKDSGKTVEDLLKSVKGMMKHSVGKALQYLKKNSVLVPETSKK